MSNCKMLAKCKKQGTEWCKSCIYGNEDAMKSQYEKQEDTGCGPDGCEVNYG